MRLKIGVTGRGGVQVLPNLMTVLTCEPLSESYTLRLKVGVFNGRHTGIR